MLAGNRFADCLYHQLVPPVVAVVVDVEELLAFLSDDLNDQRGGAGLEAVRVRIGLHSGPVVEGPIGGSERKDMTIIGDVVNTAQRVERCCPPDAFLVSEAVYAGLSNPGALQFRETAEVKGKSQPLRLYEERDAGS